MKSTLINLLLFSPVFFGLSYLSLFSIPSDNSKSDMDKVIDNWHKAAAVGDSVGFFSLMTPDAIYLGTDETERWDRTSMGKDLGKYFNGKKAWKFIPYNRIYTSLGSKNFILFDECLQTWMGPCKSTGRLTRVKGQWKISYYNLNVAVPNDVVNEYLKLLPETKVLK